MADSAPSSNPSNMPSTAESRHCYPTDPFEKDFRSVAANMTIEEMRQKLAGDFQEVTDDELRTMQSKEYAERIRPGHQWVAILEVGSFLLFFSCFYQFSSG